MAFKKIKTALPKNLDPDESTLFKRRAYYNFPHLKVKLKRNIFLTHYGIALKNMMPVSRTLPNTFGFRKPNSGFFFQFYKKGLEVLLVTKYGKSLKSMKLDESKTYLYAYSPWFGYFSWVTETLPRIYSVIERHRELTLILPEEYSRKSFVMESLKLFPDLKHEIIPEGVHMHVPKMLIPELKPYTYVFNPDEMKAFREFVWEYVSTLKIDIPTYDRIYVSRTKAKNRKLLNEAEISTILGKYSFTELAFEDYSFFEQVYLMRHCKILGGVHGAGFANVAFLPSGSDLFELIKEHSSYKEDRPSYWRLCSALGIGYSVQFCHPESYENYDLWVGVNLTADPELFEKNLILLTETKA